MPARGATQPSSVSSSDRESSTTAYPVCESSPGSSGTAPSTSSRVLVVPPRFAGRPPGVAVESPWCQVVRWEPWARVRIETDSPAPLNGPLS
ncbi:MAG TPA: hypothetical protein VIM26_13250 [Pengzhenrongella sp.]